VVDDDLQVSQADDALYHGALLEVGKTNRTQAPKHALVLGVGSAASIHHLLTRFPSLQVLGVDIDPILVDEIRPWLVDLHHGVHIDARVRFLWGDARFALATLPAGSFDMAVVNLTDPVWDAAAQIVGSTSFWHSLHRVLRSDATVCAQAGNPARADSGGPAYLTRAARDFFDLRTIEREIPSFGSAWAFAGGVRKGHKLELQSEVAVPVSSCHTRFNTNCSDRPIPNCS